MHTNIGCLEKNLKLTPQIAVESQTAGSVPSTAPVKTEDLLCYMRRDINDQERAALRARLIEVIVAEQSAHELQQIARLIDISEHNRGCSTPTEDFILRMVNNHYWEGGSLITPETVAEEIDPKNTDGFLVNFTEAMDTARRMSLAYPQLVSQNAATDPEQGPR